MDEVGQSCGQPEDDDEDDDDAIRLPQPVTIIISKEPIRQQQ